MMNHVTLSVLDLEVSKTFYDKALAPLGIQRLFNEEYYCGYGIDAPFFWISQDDQRSRVHIAFNGESMDVVKKFHEAALQAGGTDNGPAGPRPEYTDTYYAAFVLDPDGNNIEVVFGN